MFDYNRKAPDLPRPDVKRERHEYHELSIFDANKYPKECQLFVDEIGGLQCGIDDPCFYQYKIKGKGRLKLS